MLVFAAVTLLIGVIGWSNLSLALSPEAARTIAVSDGAARFAFMSHWMAWGLTLIACALILSGRLRPWQAFAVLGLCVLLIIASLSWTGGRTVGLVFSLPLMMMVGAKLASYRKIFAVTLLCALTTYIITLSDLRKQGRAFAGFDVAEALDWEFGRFSMVGFSIESSSVHGYMLGETFIASLIQALSGIPKLLGLEPIEDGLGTITEYTGEMLLGNSDITYIVPGLTAELYLNFGVFGVAVGYFLLGRVARSIDYRRSDQVSFCEHLLLCYISVLMALCLINAQSGAFIGYLIFSGAPLIALVVIERLVRTRQRSLRSAQ